MAEGRGDARVLAGQCSTEGVKREKNCAAMYNDDTSQDEAISGSHNSDSFGDAFDDEVGKMARSRRSRNPSQDLSDSTCGSEHQTTTTESGHSFGCRDSSTLRTVDVDVAVAWRSRDVKKGFVGAAGERSITTDRQAQRSKRPRRSSTGSRNEGQAPSCPVVAPPRKRRRSQRATRY